MAVFNHLHWHLTASVFVAFLAFLNLQTEGFFLKHSSFRDYRISSILANRESGFSLLVADVYSSNRAKRLKDIVIAKMDTCSTLRALMYTFVTRRDNTRLSEAIAWYYELDSLGRMSSGTDLNILMLVLSAVERMKASKIAKQSSMIAGALQNEEIGEIMRLSLSFLQPEQNPIVTTGTGYGGKADVSDSAQKHTVMKNVRIQKDLFFQALMWGSGSSWRSVGDTITEFQQHEGWTTSNVDVVTALAVVNAIIADARLPLLVSRYLPDANGYYSKGAAAVKDCNDNAGVSLSSSHIYNDSLSLINRTYRGDFDTKNNATATSLYGPQGSSCSSDPSSFLDRLCGHYELVQTDAWKQFSSFIGRSTGKKSATSHSTDDCSTPSYFDRSDRWGDVLCDQRLNQVISLTCLSGDGSIPSSTAGAADNKRTSRLYDLLTTSGSRVLIVGDGDLSFSTSLVRMHRLSQRREHCRYLQSEVNDRCPDLDFNTDIDRGDTDRDNDNTDKDTGDTDIRDTDRDNDNTDKDTGDTDIRDTDRDNDKTDKGKDKDIGGRDRDNSGSSYFLDLTVTTFETKKSLLEKYADAGSNVAFLLDESSAASGTSTSENTRRADFRGSSCSGDKSRVLYEVDATNLRPEILVLSLDSCRSQREISDADNNNRVIITGEDGQKTRPASNSGSGGDVDVLIFNFPFADTSSSSASAASSSHGSSNTRGDDKETKKTDTNAIDTTPPEKTDKKTTTNKQRTSSSNDNHRFDSYWIGRGRHMALVKGVFKSAKSVLALPSPSLHWSKPPPNKSSSPKAESSILNHEQRQHQQEQQHEHRLTSRVIITLLLSQAMEWEIEKLAEAEGFILQEIYPFEDLVLGTLGYNRKRTYNDDIFPTCSGPAAPALSSVNTGTSAPVKLTTTPLVDAHTQDTQQQLGGTVTVTVTEEEPPEVGSKGSGATSDTKSCVADELSELLHKQHLIWRDNIVNAWSFVFIRKEV